MSDKFNRSGKSPKKGGLRKFFKDREEEREADVKENTDHVDQFIDDEENYAPLKGFLPPLPEEFLTEQKREDAGCNSAALPPCSSPASVDNRNDESSSVEFDFVIESEDHTPAKKTRTKKHFKSNQIIR